MIKALMIGDSVMYGALGYGRADPNPQQILNAEQSVFNFCYNYSIGGASFAGVLSTDYQTRQANGMPSGLTLEETIELHPDAGAVLINLGGNDPGNDPAALTSNIVKIADICTAKNKLFAFVGVVDVSVLDVINNLGYTGDFIEGTVHTYRIAGNADTLRQVCVIRGYPYADIRNNIKHNLQGITSDLIHPTQDYYNNIFTYVAKAITGAQ